MPSLIKDKSGVFFIVYSVKGKRVWRSLKTTQRKEAYQRFVERQSLDPTLPRMTLPRAEVEYLSYVKTNFAPKTLSSYSQTLKHLNEFFVGKHLDQFTPRDIELYKAERASKVSHHTVNHELRCIRAFFNRLLAWKFLKESPCTGVKDIRVAQEIPAYLSKEALQKLLDFTKESRLHDIILFAAMTGLRRGEIFNLAWNDVDLDRGTILVKSNQAYQTKAGKIRVVPMNSVVRQLLEGMGRNTDFLFPGDRGYRNNGNFIRAKFKKSIRACGLDSRLHFHSLRHTFASLLVKEGVSLYHVQKLLGHSSPRVTEIYAHLGGAELLGSVEKLV